MSLRTEIKELQSTLNTFRASLAHVTLNSAAKQKMMCVIQRKLQRTQISKHKVSKELKQAWQENLTLCIEHSTVHSALLSEVEFIHVTAAATASRADALQLNIQNLRWQLEESWKKVKKLQMRNLRLQHACSDAKERTYAAEASQLFKNGSWSPQAQALMHLFVRSGTAHESVGILINAVCKAVGAPVPKKPMCHHTVNHALIEGGISARIQLGKEMRNAKSLMIASDSTSHQQIDYTSCTMVIQASDYANGTDLGSSVKIRFLGVTSSASHTSETQVEGWTETISDISTVFNNSPLAYHSHEILDLAGFLCKLKGMNGDHTSDIKKTRCLIKQWKHESIHISLGHKAIIEMSSEDLKPLLNDAESSKIAELGGHNSWISLSAEDHQWHWSQIMDMLALQLGTERFDQLPAEIQ
ncbi:uncharacterized protein BJ212DRAFT_1485871 [Suillus subaureus]|uniref:Uncharacterized protein n=1 Tax=Suillus subaureus TaxID=48587 RepID=A0A9P7E035_9AGAM|nr:uncharacterized protein BJ212DRAFT_1485871 [Suillus subaureus]KAG1807012.1 hypothetical protein BJ212DRAFT_1485871 [Suillus subaureus]